MTDAYHLAQKIVKHHVNADDNDVLIFKGSRNDFGFSQAPKNSWFKNSGTGNKIIALLQEGI